MIKKNILPNTLIKNIKIYILCACAILYVILPLMGCSAAQAPIVRTGLYFDTVIKITIYDASKEKCLDGCFELAAEYENLLSPTVEGSDIWNINHGNGEPVEVSAETAVLIKTAIHYCDITDGRIDITVETLNKLWDFHDMPSLPSKETISNALSHTDYRNIDIEGSTVTLSDSESSISLGFIAKGFIADKIKEYLISQGVDNAIIDLGGNILAIGSKPDGTPFNFGIQKPFDTQGTPIAALSVTDQSLVTSGVYERFFYQDDVLYHHILNPADGYPVRNNLLSVTILSDSSMTGDALSTSCFVLGLDEGMELIDSLDGVEAVFITDDYVLHYSKGLK
ncbi:MAG: FAD:protein FMN transferase [Butyrivibrio sp.]|nr:FAD:protein FMN transferase [Butyrivibrio sp.]